VAARQFNRTLWTYAMYALMRMRMLPDRAACMQHALWDYTIMNRVKEWDVSSQWQ